MLLQARSKCNDINSALLAQVIVVVTHGWHVLCFDHNLQLLWDRSIKVTRQPKQQQFQQRINGSDRSHRMLCLQMAECIRLAEASQLRRQAVLCTACSRSAPHSPQP